MLSDHFNSFDHEATIDQLMDRDAGQLCVSFFRSPSNSPVSTRIVEEAYRKAVWHVHKNGDFSVEVIMGTTKWRRERKKRHRILQKFSFSLSIEFFQPTDFFTRFLEPGELVLFDQCSFDTGAIGDVDLNKSEPWELPWKAKMGEKEWVFQKSSAGKKTHISGLVRLGSFSNEFSPSGLPPLMNSSPYSCKIKPVAESVNVPCFSNPINVQRNQQDTIDCFDNHLLAVSTNPLEVFPRIPLLNPFYTPQAAPVSGNLQYPGSVLMQDHSILRALIANQGTNMKQQSFKIERDMVGVSQDSTTDMNTEIYSVVSNLEVGKRSGDDQDATPSTLVASTGLDCFWNY
ncbi:hypothetical protein D5086_027742 [Populus alba]|uniref:Uncharacterized protein n=1 Tax=Populus alba TaxID=43335 RepID=A0ACC4AWA0_POPAL